MLAAFRCEHLPSSPESIITSDCNDSNIVLWVIVFVLHDFGMIIIREVDTITPGIQASNLTRQADGDKLHAQSLSKRPPLTRYPLGSDLACPYSVRRYSTQMKEMA